MKVVLLANVKNVGRIGDLAEVADGYARNFLIPQSLASPASLKIMRSVEFQKKLERNREIQEQIEAEVLAGGLQGAVVVIPAAVGGDNRIHGQITNQQIADAIERGDKRPRYGQENLFLHINQSVTVVTHEIGRTCTLITAYKTTSTI